ncbi:hypothetical protein LSH36_1010g00075, partial [Paralvinella palmiformis]
MVFTEARRTCLTWISDLVIISSEDENNFISHLTDTNVWIGLQNNSSGDTFVWVNGSSLGDAFSNWQNDTDSETSGGNNNEV